VKRSEENRGKTGQREATKDVSVIIVSYNVRDFLEQCLHSIRRACEHLHAEVLVVDNASHDGSSQMVKSQFPWVRLTENRINLGFAKANNQALKLAGGRYVLLINPDTLAREDTVQNMLEFLRTHPEAGAAGCKILNPDGTLQLSCRRSFPTPWVALSKILGLGRLFPRSRFFGKYNLTYLDPEKTSQVDALSGSFMFLRREALQQVGFFDEQYFMYGEDLDLCYRIKRAGWKIYYLPTTQIIHYKGRSTEASASTVLDFYRAMYIFVGKHLRRRYLFFLHWFLTLGIATRAAVSFLGRVLRRTFPVFLDLILVNLALLAAIIIRFGSLIPLPPFSNHFSYLVIHGVCSFVWLGSFWSLGLYDRRRYSPVQAFWAVTLAFLLISTLTYFKQEYAFSRIAILTNYLLNLILIPGWRLLFRLVVKTPMGRALVFKRALIVGGGQAGRAILARLRGRLDLGYRVVGFVSNGLVEQDDAPGDLPLLGHIHDMPQILKREKIEEVIVTTTSSSYASILELMTACSAQQVNFKLIPSPYEVMIGDAQIDRIDDVPMVDMRYRPFLAWNRLVKRTTDVVISAGLLMITSPLAVLWGVLRKLRPNRYCTVGRKLRGRGDKPILVATHEIDVTIAGMSGRFPRFHYRWALDKLPLLWSVLRGHLSLVGSELLENGSTQGSALKPGLTGFVQIHLQDGLTDEEKAEYQIYYLRHQSLMLDAQVLLRALWNLITNVAGRRRSSWQATTESQQTKTRSGHSLNDERVENERVRPRF
jgi:GT2 family glycosyltransferase/lipopolysaccharide/colanic/teichoic acid biosynthesis glycosyltransferase